jgi:hypothetical protein
VIRCNNPVEEVEEVTKKERKKERKSEFNSLHVRNKENGGRGIHEKKKINTKGNRIKKNKEAHKYEEATSLNGLSTSFDVCPCH